MTNYLQIQGDPTTWWPAQPVQAARLTQPTLNVTIEKPLVGGILVISTGARRHHAGRQRRRRPGAQRLTQLRQPDY